MMKPILETNRLLLRTLTLDDAENLYLLNLNPNVVKYTGNPAFKDIDEAEQFLKNYQDYTVNGYGRWAVISKETNKFIGWCGLKYDKIDDTTDIGYRFLENEWYKGYATESAIACLQYGFQKLNLHQIIGVAMTENVNSIKVLQKIGLEYEKEIIFEGKAAVRYQIEQTKWNHPFK